jgi:hypothetical protein
VGGERERERERESRIQTKTDTLTYTLNVNIGCPQYTNLDRTNVSFNKCSNRWMGVVAELAAWRL